MAEPASKLPEEDRPDIAPDAPALRSREEHAGRGSPGSRTRGDHPGSGPGSTRRSRQRGDHGGGFYNPGELGGAEQEAAEQDSLYNPGGDRTRFFGRRKSPKNNKRGFLRRNKLWVGIITTIVTGSIALSMFFFASIFDLPNFMKNIEAAGFQRYQLDMNGRSSKWLQAYMQLRFGEVDDPSRAVGDRDNIFFRSDRVDTNRPLTDWYRTLRTSKFEQDLFESKGIRFTSEAYQKGNIIAFRPGKITFPNAEVQVDPRKLGYDQLDTLSDADVSRLNGQLEDAFDHQRFGSDKEARVAISAILKENYPQWWKAGKRYFIRQNIQNMIGVRNWTFFEKTRTKIHEGTVSMRNRVITQAFPGESATGDFIKCLFGVPDCKASSDPGNPDASELPETGEQKQGDKTNGDQKNPQPVGDGSSEAALEDVSKTAASSAGDLTNKILSKVIARAGALSMLDSLSRFDQALHDHKLSKVIVAARAAQAAGMFSVFGVAADQLTTGQQSSSEVNDFMLQFKHGTNAEGWTKVVDPQGGQGAASAASTGYTQAKDKAEFCSPQHQAEMDAHPKQAEKEFQWLCPKDRVGGGNNAQELEDAWNSGAGGVLHPMLAAFRSSVGGVFDVFNSVIGAVTDPLIHAGLSVTGTQDDVNRAVAWGGGKALQFGGFNTVSDDTPSGQISNQVLQGSSVIAEASTRDQGGIPSTAVSMQETQKQLAEAQQEYGQTSAFNRYLSPSNPKSLFARELFAITTSGFTNIGKNFIGVFGAALSNPLRALTQPAHAAVPDGYAACHFTGITCMDIPQQCIDGPTITMTPRQATNADDLGYFKPGELSWDLLNNRNDWYKALYDKVGGDEDKALKVYNCALFDDAARGSMSARYGYAGVNSFQSGGQSAQSGGSAAAVSGDARQLAQQILNNNKISKTGRYVTEDLQHTANGVPAYGNVNIALNLLQFMAELGETTPFTITSITGAGCGHDITNGVSLCVSQGGNSNHYFGKAVDFGCGFDEAKADEVAKKYGLMAQNERCDSGINHSHFSKDGY